MKENNKSEAFTVSLRDHFAMAALTGIISHGNDLPDGYCTPRDEIAQIAYKYADSMIQERGKSSSSRYGKKK